MDKPHNTASGRPQSPSQELAELDRKLTKLLARRVDLMAEIAGRRRSRQGKLVDPRQEKGLWKIWKQVRDDKGLDSRILEQLFTLTNALSYARAEQGRTSPGFVLSPARKPFRLETDGPANPLLARAYICLAAAGKHSLHLRNMVLNDAMVELIKLLNQAGGNFSWTPEGDIAGSAEGNIRFDAQTVFCGQDPFNFFFGLALAVHELGTSKFTGSTGLRTTDLTGLRAPLASMGARIVHLDPHSTGLPVRVESTGIIPEHMQFDSTTPADFIRAFLLVAATREGVSSLAWPEEMHSRILTEEIGHILKEAGHTAISSSGITFDEKPLRIPEQPEVGLDPELCAHLLALPLGAPGEVRLLGEWDSGSSRAREYIALLDHALAVEDLRGSVQSARKNVHCPALRERLFSPLGLAMAIMLGANEYTWETAEEPDLDFAQDFLQRAGFEIQTAPGSIAFSSIPQTGRDTPPFTVPSPQWAMALALIAFRVPGLIVLNPGIITSVWPAFWGHYNGLHGQKTAGKTPEKKHDRKRRRILT